MRRKAFKTLGHNINRKMSNIKCSLGIQNDGQRNINVKCRTNVQLMRSGGAIIHSALLRRARGELRNPRVQRTLGHKLRAPARGLRA